MIRAVVAWCLAAVVIMGLLLAPARVTHAAALSSCATSQLQLVPGSAPATAGTIPVVFIHGIISNSNMWHGSSAGSIAWRAARMSGVTAWTFNYGPENLDWVTNNLVGGNFATAISCLSRESANDVIIVSHSMGGLAAQYAFAQPDASGGTIGDHVAELITIGTPYQGSELLTVMQDLRLGVHINAPLAYLVMAEAITSACANRTTGICALLRVMPSQVGTALELYSGKIAALPPWPAHLRVVDIAGDMGLLIPVGPFVHRFDIGDVAVTVGSATAHHTIGIPVVKHCNSLHLLGAIYGNPGPCFHSNLVNDSDIITDVVDALHHFANRNVYFACCGFVPSNPQADLQNSYRPHTLIFDATGSHVIENATWLEWNSIQAIAYGTASVNSCSPACAGGHFNKDSVVATFSDPLLCHGHWYWSKAVMHFPRGIPVGVTQDSPWITPPDSQLC